MKKSSWLFIMILIVSTIMVVSANNWMSMWMGLEINLLSFTPLILNKTNKSSSEAAMMYFLIQSVSSMILMMMILNMMYSTTFMKMINNMIITMSILIKMGAAPFHAWMPEIMSKMEWNKCLMLMTWQKVAPLMMMSNINNNFIINLSIIWSTMIGSLGGINQTSVRKMFGYSSINHLGWLMAINKSMNKWMIYLLTYSLLMMFICFTMMHYKIYFLNQMNNINMSNMEKVSMFIMMMSMGGMPPFIGFLPKWIVIQSMIHEKEFIMILIMIMFSLITLMYYMRIIINMTLFSNSSLKWIKNNSNNLPLIMILINFSLPMIMII
uniref:NADH-ubiquinone oxidoreductase chain 2 n=1 Tax=Halyomorpha halys TaxID=286706 RepID=A0A7G1PUM7_HALHY|nr:NADH dehydrogenase subunit 2 [Halyomorpha halys]